MKLGPSILAIATVATRDCDLENYQSKVNFYGCITKRNGLTYPGDNGASVFNTATCQRAVCLKTKEKSFNIVCTNGALSLPAGFCDIEETMDTLEEGILSNLGERLSTSGLAGSAHVTDATQEQINIDEYPDKLIIYGSYTPGKHDTSSFKGQGVYKIYTQNDVDTKFTQRKPIYQHTTDPKLFFSFSSKTMEWRVTTKKSIAKKSSYCNFKSFYGIMHDPTKFSSWTGRKCFIDKKWKDTDLMIADYSDDLRVRQRLCPNNYVGKQFNAQSMGQLKLTLEGSNWKQDITLPNVLKTAPVISTHSGFSHNFGDIVAIEGIFDSKDALCLSELSIMKGGNAINLLHLLKKDSKIQKWSWGWMVSWWDSDPYNDSAWPHGTVALVNPTNPNKLEDISHHYYKFVHFVRNFIMPKSVSDVSGGTGNEGVNKVTFKPVEEDREKPTPKPTVTSTNQPASLHCDVEEMESKFGLHFSNCKVQSKYRPSDSKSNQGRFNNKVLNGSVCQMKCASYPKKPFKHTKMECKCTSNSRFKVFKNLKELIQNGPKPMDLLFKSCSWYDASNKKSNTAVIPINVFGILKCPAGCPSGLINTSNHTCDELTRFNKACTLQCPGQTKAVKTKCVINKKTRQPKFTKLC